MINYIEKYHSHLYYLLAILCFGLFILQRINGLSLKIGNAFPVLLVPAVIMIACFLREWTGFLAGLLSGIALDTVTNGTTCFNTITLMLLGVSAGLIFRLLMNRNIKSALIIGFLGCLVYFVAKWFFLDVLSGDASAMQLLLRYHLPSALYTAVFTVPFFFFVRKLTKKYLIQQ